MPLRNRVTPFGRLEAVAVRGALMGNRGCLHDAQGRIGEREWRSRAWIACVLEGYRPINPPGGYTQLFFHDEAVALAAGHRPCAFCRRKAYRRFRDLWGEVAGCRPSAAEMDAALHATRLTPGGQKRTVAMPLGAVPEGAFVAVGAEAFLVSAGALHPFAHVYGPPRALDLERVVAVLTPEPTLAVLARGYRPACEPTATVPPSLSRRQQNAP